MNDKEYIVFYRHFYEAIKLLPKDVQADLYNAFFTYYFTGKILEMDDEIKSFFILMVSQMNEEK
jgi:hypothetical protein